MNKWKIARNGYLFLAAAFSILGIVYIFLPDIPPMAACALSGAVLIVYGIIKMVGYFSRDLYCLAFQHDFACGLLLMALGVIVLACNSRVIPYLSPGLGLLVLLDSVLAIQMCLDAKRFGLETWFQILIVSIVAGLLGAILLIHPYQTRRAAHLVAGCTLLVEGAKNCCVILNAAKAEKRPSATDSEEPGSKC